MNPLDLQLQAFWNWFSERSAYFEQTPPEQYEPDQLHAINNQLRQLAEELSFEFSILPGANTIEMAISANSQIERFSLVKQLVAQAPSLPGWRFLAFKQAYPYPDELVIESEGLSLAVARMFFYPLVSGDRINIILYAKHISQHPRNKVAGLALALAANLLGEYRDALYVGTYDIQDVDKLKGQEREGIRPLRELPAYLDSRFLNQN